MRIHLPLAAAVLLLAGCASPVKELPIDRKMIQEAEVAVAERRFGKAIALYEEIAKYSVFCIGPSGI